MGISWCCDCPSDKENSNDNRSSYQEKPKTSNPKNNQDERQHNMPPSSRPILQQTFGPQDNISTAFQTKSYQNKSKNAQTFSPLRRTRQKKSGDDRHSHPQIQRQFSQQQPTSLIKGNSNIEILIQDAFNASNLKSYEQACRLFQKALTTLESPALREEYNQQNLEQHRILILLELIQIETVRNRRTELERYYVKCLKSFENIPEYKAYENKITLMNNYSLFLREENKFQQAIHLCHKALKLQEKYYTHCDLRMYTTLTNMACLYNENGQSVEAENIYQKINLCRDSFTRQVASQNQKYQKMSIKIAK